MKDETARAITEDYLQFRRVALRIINAERSGSLNEHAEQVCLSLYLGGVVLH